MNTKSIEPPGTFKANIMTAARYWEPRRIAYNLILAAVAVIWLVSTWPHFSPGLTLKSLLILLVLAAIANVCYSAAYLADILLKFSNLHNLWQRHKWSIWLTGTIFAVILECYWIADEIYPYVK
jgi:hypothetical protein